MDDNKKNISFNNLVNSNINNNAVNNKSLFSDNSSNIFNNVENNNVYVQNNNVNIQNNKSVNQVPIHNGGMNSGNIEVISLDNSVTSDNNISIDVSINSVQKNIADNKIKGSINESNVNNIDNKKINNFFMIFTNKKVFLVLALFTFAFTSITVGKTFYLRNAVNEYQDFFVDIEKKESEEAVYYIGEELSSDSLKNVAASEYIKCLNSSVDINDLPGSVTSIVDEINGYYNRSNNYFAFKYKDIYTGFSVSYNENQNIFTASTIKAPKDIYIYEMASEGKINLDEELIYTSRYANSGAWILNNKGFNTKHTVRDLVKYSTSSSDNASHNMLMDHFGRNNMFNFWQQKGTTAIFTANNNWGVTNAHDASIYMEELYKFYLENEVYGEELMNNFLNANPKFIKGKNNYMVANKSGWSGTAIHDVSIIFADNPYIVVALSNLGETDYYMSYFNKANDLAYRLHTEYWKYKMESCGSINQY